METLQLAAFPWPDREAGVGAVWEWAALHDVGGVLVWEWSVLRVFGCRER